MVLYLRSSCDSGCALVYASGGASSSEYQRLLPVNTVTTVGFVGARLDATCVCVVGLIYSMQFACSVALFHNFECIATKLLFEISVLLYYVSVLL